MFSAWGCNTAWMAAGWPELRAFHRATRDVPLAQQRVLSDIVAANRTTAFGQQHDFDRIGSVADFQHRVPIRSYDDFRPYIDRIAAGEQHVLTTDRMTSLQPTSGTSSGRKLIPYTRSLQRQFQRALQAWIGDLFGRLPAVRDGRAYWSITPALGNAGYTSGGIPIGFSDDTEYLGTCARLLARRMLVAPNWLAQVDDLKAFRYLTLLNMLLAEDLALVSVWSPTFLTGLLGDLTHWREPLIEDLASANWPPSAVGSLPTGSSAPMSMRAMRRRGALLRDVLRNSTDSCAQLTSIWPGLALVSCWADGAAAGPFEVLRQLMPGVRFQAKGLLATEGFVSFPLVGSPAAALAVRSHFFEFLACDPTTSTIQPRLAHELELGGRYEVLLTTAGGLYRYRLGDQVQVIGRLHTCPLIRFTGRVDGTCDLVGEKLSDSHVGAILERLASDLGFRPAFALLVPVVTEPRRYRLYVQDRRVLPDQLANLAHLLEQGLAENPHYRYAVGLGQLAGAEVGLLDPIGPSGWDLYHEHRLATGQRLGDIKPAVLDTTFPAAERLDPWVLTLATSAAEPSSRSPQPATFLPQHPADDAGERGEWPR